MKIPEIRFPEFSGEWVEKRMGEIGEIKYGKGQNEITNKGGIYPIIGTGGILGNSGEYLYDKESVILGRKGTIDKPIYINKPFWCVDTTYYFKFYKAYLPKFIFYLLNKINWKMYNESTGVPSLSSNTIKKIKIHIPPILTEQEKIAEFLSAVDEKIEITAKKIEKLKDYKKGLLQKMLNVINGEPEIRFKEFSGKWVEKKLKDICKFEKGTSITSNDIVKGNIPVIAGGKEPAYYHNQYNREGDIITVSSSGANAGFVNYFECPIFASDCFTIQGLNKLAITKFIFYILKLLQNKIFSLQSGGAQPHIYIKDLNLLKIYIPPTLEEQQKIADFLSSIDEKIELNENRLKALKTYKKGLLQKMFV